MKAYIQVKQVGKRKCSIEKMPIDFPTPPASVQELILSLIHISEPRDKRQSRMPSSA